MEEPKKKAIDSISRAGAVPVVETVPAHAAELPAGGADTAAEAAAATEGGADTFESLFPEPGVSISSPPSWIWWLVLLVLSLVLGGIGYAVARNRINDWLAIPTPAASAAPASAAVTATPTAAATPAETAAASPTPSTTPTATFTLRVLNGTTTGGAAAKAESVLQKAGFTVRTVGNAKNQGYATTYVYYKTGFESQANSVAAALSDYSVSVQESTALASPDSILVVVGKK